MAELRGRDVEQEEMDGVSVERLMTDDRLLSQNQLRNAEAD